MKSENKIHKLTSEIRVYIQPSMQRAGILIWVQAVTATCGINFNYKDGQIIEIEVPDDRITDDLKPFLELPMMFANQLLKGIVEYSNNNGIKTKDQTLIEGKLIATELHLKDMQEFSTKLLDFVTSKKLTNEN